MKFTKGVFLIFLLSMSLFGFAEVSFGAAADGTCTCTQGQFVRGAQIVECALESDSGGDVDGQGSFTLKHQAAFLVGIIYDPGAGVSAAELAVKGATSGVYLWDTTGLPTSDADAGNTFGPSDVFVPIPQDEPIELFMDDLGDEKSCNVTLIFQ